MTSSTASVGMMWGAAAIFFVLATAFVPGVIGLVRTVALTRHSLTRRFLGPVIAVVGYVALFVWAQHLVRLYDAGQPEVAFLPFTAGFTAGLVYNVAVLGGLVLGWTKRPRR